MYLLDRKIYHKIMSCTTDILLWQNIALWQIVALWRDLAVVGSPQGKIIASSLFRIMCVFSDPTRSKYYRLIDHTGPNGLSQYNILIGYATDP